LKEETVKDDSLTREALGPKDRTPEPKDRAPEPKDRAPAACFVARVVAREEISTQPSSSPVGSLETTLTPLRGGTILTLPEGRKFFTSLEVDPWVVQRGPPPKSP